MKNLIKKINGAIALLAIASVGYAYGDNNDNNDNNNLPAYGECNDCYSCQPACCGCGNGFISAELLYWRPFVGGIDECGSGNFSETIASDGRVISRFNGRARNPDFDWDPGFRLGAGYEFACSNWGVAAFYTYFHSRSHGSNSHDSDSNSSESYGFDNRENRLRWNINFDLIDVVAGYEADVGSCFTFRPFIGLRGARIDQKVHRGHFQSSGDNFSTSSNDYFSTNRNHFGGKNHEKFTGVGPLVGIEADWNVWCGFRLYANASTSWLYGKFRVRLNEFDNFDYFDDFCHIRKNLDATLANFDAGLGIRWETCFCGDMRLFLQLGLEHHQYFNYNRIGEYGDLSFDGVNFSVAIGF